jgi:hypothetical protein
MQFYKEDLLENDYDWDEASDILFSGEPTRRLFNRHNGNQVLFIINHIAGLSPDFSIAEGQRMEKQLRNQLPLEAKSEISVLNWLRKSEPIDH